MTGEIAGPILLLVFVLANGFMTAARAALINAPRQQLRDKAEEGHKRAALALTLAEESSRLLATARVGQMLAGFLSAALAALVFVPVVVGLLASAPSLEPYAESLSYVLVTLLAALIFYVLGEVLPEHMAVRYAERWALALAGPMQFAERLLRPFVGVILFISRALARPFGGLESGLSQVTEEEILTLVDAGQEEGVIEQEEKQMIASIFKLNNTFVREVMVPRIDMVALAADAPLKEALETVIEAGHSRIPVYKENMDSIVGLLYAKDLLEVWRDGKADVNLETLLREAPFVPETKRVDDLLRELQQTKVHLAIVVDEYGGTAGLVTIEDIVEEIVGEIQDEYDTEEVIYRQISEDEYEIDARMDMDDFNELLDCELPTELGDTLGGFIYSRLGKVPIVGEEVEADNLHLKVLSVNEQRIQQVRVRRVPEAKSETNDTNGTEHD